ncbi:MAG: HAMP domain-containing sensor histidine kinase [Betaproteobacteria bacterium]
MPNSTANVPAARRSVASIGNPCDRTNGVLSTLTRNAPAAGGGEVISAAVFRQTETVWRSLVTFCVYRVIIAVTLMVSVWGFQRYQLLIAASPALALWSLAFYFMAAVGMLGLANLRLPRPALHLTAQVVVDVVSMTLLMHAAGGVKSGIGLLLLVTLAASGLVARGRIAYFHAAIAALAILLEQSWQFLSHDAPAADFLQTGLLAGSYFLIAGLGYTLAKYARGAEQIAEERGVDLANLAQINELVIRDMQDGFVVVDEKGLIRQHNPQSEALIGGLKFAGSRTLAEASPHLAILLEEWRRDPERIFSMMRDQKTQKDYQVRFVAIGKTRPAPTVVFIEDASRIRAQAQQMKLVALGRLTASIAHEIRNPLSSINHAAELLQEDSEQSARRAEDTRLLTIIRDNAHRLDRMVEEVLYLNRRDRAHPEPLDARTYLERFVQDFCANEKLPANAIDLTIHTRTRPVFDRSHLDQVLWNLARNARHHGSGRPGSTRISLHAGTLPGTVTLDVIDDGPGLSAEVLQHLFEPFFTTDTRGTGLGLYIARELADVNGARLECVVEGRATDSGACFRLTMTGSP